MQGGGVPAVQAPRGHRHRRGARVKLGNGWWAGVPGQATRRVDFRHGVLRWRRGAPGARTAPPTCCQSNRVGLTSSTSSSRRRNVANLCRQGSIGTPRPGVATTGARQRQRRGIARWTSSIRHPNTPSQCQAGHGLPDGARQHAAKGGRHRLVKGDGPGANDGVCGRVTTASKLPRCRGGASHRADRGPSEDSRELGWLLGGPA